MQRVFPLSFTLRAAERLVAFDSPRVLVDFNRSRVSAARVRAESDVISVDQVVPHLQVIQLSHPLHVLLLVFKKRLFDVVAFRADCRRFLPSFLNELFHNGANLELLALHMGETLYFPPEQFPHVTSTARWLERVWLWTAPNRFSSLHLIGNLRLRPVEGTVVTDYDGAWALVDLHFCQLRCTNSAPLASFYLLPLFKLFSLLTALCTESSLAEPGLLGQLRGLLHVLVLFGGEKGLKLVSHSSVHVDNDANCSTGMAFNLIFIISLTRSN